MTQQYAFSPLPRRDSGIRDLRPSNAVAAKRFRFWQVEPLLNKAADLLDRCLADAKHLDWLNSQHASMATAVTLENATVGLAQRRNQANYSAALLNVRKSNEDGMEHYRHAKENAEQQHNTEKSSSSAVQFNVRYVEWQRWIMAMALTTRELANVASDSVDEKLFLDTCRGVVDQKYSFFQPGGPWAFQHRAAPVRKRIERDYSQAIEHLLIASEGLTKIYGYSLPFEKVFQKLDKDPGLDAIDEVVAWSREAIRWMLAFSHRDQSFVELLSLRQLLEPPAWGELISNPGGKIPFWCLADRFRQHHYVRLRGISASVVLRQPSAALRFKVQISAPKISYFNHDTDLGLSKSSVDQKDLPPCVVGNVCDVSVQLPPEVFGAISLMNASPISDNKGAVDSAWRISIQEYSLNSARLLDDVLVLLHLTGRPVLAP